MAAARKMLFAVVVLLSLTEARAQIARPPVSPQRQLQIAVHDDLLGVAQYALGSGADAAWRSADGAGLLHDARSAEMVDLLISSGADPNAASNGGVTPLLAALRAGWMEVAVALLESGANANARGADDETPLGRSIAQGDPTAVLTLLEHRADPNLLSKRTTPLRLAVERPSAAIVKLLLAAGADAKVAGADGRTPLHEAARHGDVEIVRLLLAGGADVTAATPAGTTPLHEAAAAVHAEVVKVLLAAHAGATSLAEGRTPLAAVVRSDLAWGDEAGRIVVQLTAAGADPNETIGGVPLLARALADRRSPIAEALLDAGADPNVRVGNDGRSAIEWVAQGGIVSAESLMEKLIAHRATLATAAGRAPLVCTAIANDQEALAKQLIRAQAPLEPCDASGRTPLISAAIRGLQGTAAALLAVPVPVDARDANEFTALMHAAANGHREIVSALIAAGADRTLSAGGVTAADVASWSEHPELFPLLGPVTNPLTPQQVATLQRGAVVVPRIMIAEAVTHTAASSTAEMPVTTATIEMERRDPDADAAARVEAALKRSPTGVRLFPVTPPRPTTSCPLNPWLPVSRYPTLRDVATTLQTAFARAGYSAIHWYWVPGGGFALVSDVEQIDDQARPLQQNRFARLEAPKVFSLWSLIKAMFTATPGYYRVVAVVVSRESLAPGAVNPEAVERMGQFGWSSLPNLIGQLAFNERYQSVALLYEMRQASPQDKPKFATVPVGGLAADQQLRLAGVIAALEGP